MPNIILLSGDGIGHEIMAEAERVLEDAELHRLEAGRGEEVVPKLEEARG